MDIESKLNDVTVTAIPLIKNQQTANNMQMQQQQQQHNKMTQNQIQQQLLLQQQQQLQMQLNQLNVSAGGGMSYLQNTSGLSKYGQLLAVIEEMGRDIRPTYSGSRTSAERLKRGIVHARILVRECLLETERSSARN